MTAYIDRAFYAEKTGAELPDSPLTQRQIETASDVIADAMRNDVYAAGPDMLPLDDVQRHAVQWATVMQTYALVEAEIDPLTAGVAGTVSFVTAASMGSASYSVSTADAQAAETVKAAMLTDPVPTAIRVLRRVGLASITIGT